MSNPIKLTQSMIQAIREACSGDAELALDAALDQLPSPSLQDLVEWCSEIMEKFEGDKYDACFELAEIAISI